MEPEWVIDIKRQCEQFGVAFFFKQWGAYDETGKRVGKKKLVEFSKDELGTICPSLPFRESI